MCNETGGYTYQVVSGEFAFAATFSEEAKLIIYKFHSCFPLHNLVSTAPRFKISSKSRNSCL